MKKSRYNFQLDGDVNQINNFIQEYLKKMILQYEKKTVNNIIGPLIHQ